MMSRALAILLVVCSRAAAADPIDSSVAQLGDSTYKVRLAATLALSKSKDPRAVIAIAEAVGGDPETSIRRIAAHALEKMVDHHTAEDARALAIDALEQAAASDGDQKVRASAAKAFRLLVPLRPKPHEAAPAEPRGDRPEVFVQIDGTTDQSRRAPTDAGDRVTRIVKKSIERTGYATSWPGGLPTSAELTSSKSRAFIVASTVKKIDISKAGSQTLIACTVAIRIAPWTGTDGGEKWESSKVASASGSAKATTGSTDREIASGLRDCLEAVAEDVTSRQVVPFLKHLAQGS